MSLATFNFALTFMELIEIRIRYSYDEQIAHSNHTHFLCKHFIPYMQIIWDLIKRGPFQRAIRDTGGEEGFINEDTCLYLEMVKYSTGGSPQVK